ncbi:MAG: hypothetical protein ACTHMB_25115, partial [Candidatus Binatia bacterium]
KRTGKFAFFGHHRGFTAYYVHGSSEIFPRIPYATEQGIISVKQRTSLREQGSYQAGTKFLGR